jgi:hypothetical protein
MKKKIRFIEIANCLIKNFFSNKQKNDIYHGCENVLNPAPVNNENEAEEYMKNYQSTTRWQTL